MHVVTFCVLRMLSALETGVLASFTASESMSACLEFLFLYFGSLHI